MRLPHAVSRIARTSEKLGTGAVAGRTAGVAILVIVLAAGRADDAVDLAAIERSFQSVAKQVGPAVVSIRVERRFVAPLAGGGGSNAAGDSLDHLIVVNGSGSIVREDGLILTNEHVIQSATTIDVVLASGEKRPGRVHASDPRSDLAVLKIDKSGLRTAEFCDWSAVRRGQWAFVVGNPYGLGADGRSSVSVGVVSNLGRRLPGLGEVDDRFYGNMIQTTAAINPGNSGGPLFNLHGELVGVVTAMHTRAGQSDGIGFAIAMTPTKRTVVERLMRGEAIEYGFIGLSVRDMDAGERRAAGVVGDTGVTVVQVEAGGPAAKADARVGDVVLAVDGSPVSLASEMAEMVGLAPVGRELAIRLKRGGVESTVNVAVEARDVARVSWLRGGAILWRGMRLANLTTDAKASLSVSGPAGGVVVIDVAENSAASRARVRIGDVIERAAGAAVSDVNAFRQSVSDENGAVTVSLRGGGERVVAP